MKVHKEIMGSTSKMHSTIAIVTPNTHPRSIICQPDRSNSVNTFHLPDVSHVCDKNVSNPSTLVSFDCNFSQLILALRIVKCTNVVLMWLLQVHKISYNMRIHRTWESCISRMHGAKALSGNEATNFVDLLPSNPMATIATIGPTFLRIHARECHEQFRDLRWAAPSFLRGYLCSMASVVYDQQGILQHLPPAPGQSMALHGSVAMGNVH